MLREGLGDLRADGVHRVERGHRLLEHHGDDAAAQALARALVEPVHVLAVHGDHAAHPRVRALVQPEDGPEGDALARAGFAEDGEDPARLEREGDVAHRAHGSVARLECHAEVADGQ